MQQSFVEKTAPESQNMSKIISWSSISQIVVGIATGIVFLLFWFLSPAYVGFSNTLFILLFLYILLGVFYLIVSRERSSQQLWLLFFTKILTDLVVITLSIHFAGEYHGLFLFLYALPIITASLVSSRFATWTLIFSLVSYFFLEFHELFIITTVGWAPIAGSVLEELQHFVVLLLLGFLIAFQSSYYTNHIKDMYEQLAKLKEEFLFRTIHDLRSPLTTFGWMLEKYQRPNFIKQYPDMEQDIATMQDLTARMKNIIHDLTAVINGEQKDIILKKEKVNIEEILLSVIAEAKPLLIEHSIKVNLEPIKKSFYVLVDEQALKEALINIVENAAKYNVPNGLITISCHTEDKYLRIDINDTGRGISKENMQKLFVPYFRGDVDKNAPGTGLGLYIRPLSKVPLCC